LSNQHDKCKKDAVSDEGATHDEMRKTLSEMIPSAISQSSDPPKQHLYPGHNWHCLSHDAMTVYRDLSNLAMETFCDMELQIDTENDLDGEHQHQGIRE
jgi:hypothetical protein